VKVVHLDEIQGTRIGDALWKPIRSTLGTRAFGINAYVCANAGERLFDEHDETEAGAGNQRHEELYFVLAGRATFTVDGKGIDAPAGTFVFVEDPAARRAAVAAEPDTTVLALGGPVGEGYEVAPWEYWFRIRAARESGDVNGAHAIAAEGLARYPADPRLRREVSEGPGPRPA
jgi:hypothetical protein